MKNKTNLFLFGSVALILLAVVLVTVIEKTSPISSSTDVRARAGTQYALKFTATVNTINETKGTINVTGVQLADSNRIGDPQSLGDWTVTVPPSFNFASVSQGMTVTIGVDASTFNMTSHAVTAVSITL